MRNSIITVILFIILLFAACTGRPKYDVRLVGADSLMHSKPDSALRILLDMPVEEFAIRADSAYYALLLTQAKDKNYIVHKNDSLIRMAVEYYDAIGDKRMRAKARYYLGSVYRDMNKQAEAIREYLIAAPLTDRVKDKRQLGLIYNNIGYIYNLQGFIEKADSIYQLAEVIAEELKDTAFRAQTLFMQGSIALKKGDEYLPNAEKKLLDAFVAANQTGYNALKADIAASLSNMYSRMNQGDKALHYAILNLSLRGDTARAYQAFLVLGDAYYRCGQYDSATIYLNKSLMSKDYGRRVEIYQRLADIAMKQGNSSLSMELERKSSAYKDSLYYYRRNAVVSKVVDAEVEAQVVLHQIYSKKRMFRYLYLFISACVLIVAIVFVLYRNNKHYREKNNLLQKDKQQLEKLNKDLSQHYADLQIDITQKNQEINELKKELTSRRINEEQKVKLQAELDEMVLKRRALAKEAFLYSPLYKKMQAIIKDYQEKDNSDMELSDEEWRELVIGMDLQWNNAVSDLSARYQLSKEELHLVCLGLTGFPFSHLEYLLHLSRKTLYRKKNTLFMRIGAEQNSGFEDILLKNKD